LKLLGEGRIETIQLSEMLDAAASGDTSKPANEGHLKTGQWKQAGRDRYTRLWSVKARNSSPWSAELNYTVKT
jgi:hypothetical protein